MATSEKSPLCKTGRCQHQRRHWMVTVQLSHMGCDEETSEGDVEASLREMWETACADPRVGYGCGQLERGGEGRLHGQMYLEFSKSLRNTQVRKVLPGWATHMLTTRTNCRTYCRKASDDESERVARLPDFGEWNPERGYGVELLGPKQRCLQMLVKEGMTPEEIAKSDPEAYFTFHAAIKATWNALQDSSEFD